MVFCFQNCSDHCKKLFQWLSKTFAKLLRQLEQFIQTVNAQTIFEIWFLTCYLGFQSELLVHRKNNLDVESYNNKLE